MKYKIVLSNQFRRDLKRIIKRGQDTNKLEHVVNRLASGERLDIKNHDHNLSGEFSGFRECHISPDWLLIYKIEENELILLLMRTGTHSDLF